MSVFDCYAPFIQEYIYRNRWQDLRAIQVAAGEAILHSDDNLLLTASTASGKTEAAFFPILTLFSQDMPKSVGCIYIGPLKALINDQFERLTELCREGGIPVWHWHGDVAQSHKERLLKNPGGILQITPESLEALLLHRQGAVARLFSDLRFVVIDEVHSLLRGDRGGQTLCLIQRLSRLAGVNPRRIGLSATIGDPQRTGEFLSLGTGRRTRIPRIREGGTPWRLSMEHFYVSDVQAGEGKVPDAPRPLEEPMAEAPENPDPALGYLFRHSRGKKCLLFVNSREECETVTTTLRRYCEALGERDRFLIHHGNLSAAYRQTAEGIMKDDSQCFTTVTTATLELGIDIGRLERAFQIDAPWTVSSFLQRMGRTGRRDRPPEMWFVVREEQPDPRAMVPSTVPWKLLQGIALVQLYREERWVEPPRLDRLPYSLLYHQTMSILASSGELSPGALAERVLGLTYFHRVTREDLRTLLRHLVATDHIRQTEQGGLMVSLAGERVIRSFRFYGVFQENEEYTVRSESQELGTVVLPPPVGEKVAIAGHVWEVLEVDHKRRLVYCTQVRGTVPAYFGQCPGDLHTRVLERMRQVLLEEQSYPYVMKNALARLEQARHTAAHSGVAREPLIRLGGSMWCLAPWVGTYTFLALERFLRIHCAGKLGLKQFDSARPYYMQFSMTVGREDFYRILGEVLEEDPDPMSLLYPGETPMFDKYDPYLPPELTRKGFALGVLDTQEMKTLVGQWIRQWGPAAGGA